MKDDGNEFPWERLYNKKLYFSYVFLIFIISASYDHQSSLFRLILGSFFISIWTFVAGLLFFIVAKAITSVFLANSWIDKGLLEYAIWVIPISGFSFFLFTISQ